MGSLYITAILGFIILYLIYWWIKKTSNYWKERGVPCGESHAIVGNMKEVLQMKKTWVQVTTDIYKKFSGQKFCGCYMFTTPVLLIRDIDLINQILIKDFTHFQDRNYPGDENLELFNISLANLTGDKWKVLRHKMTPTFTSGKMKNMLTKMRDCGEEAVLHLKEKRGEDLDIRDFLFKYMINVIADVSFGIKADAFTKENDNSIVQMSKRLFSPSIKLQCASFLAVAAPNLKNFLRLKMADTKVNDFFKKLSHDLAKYRNQSDKRNDFFQLLLDERQKELNILESATGDKINQQTTLSNDVEPEDLELLDHLKNVKYDKNYKVFTDDVIAAQTFIFVAGGTETTAAALSFALYELAVNKDVQTRAQKEVDCILASQEFSYDAVKKMTYLDQILNEVMRLRPAGGSLPRICTKDYKLPGTDFIVKKGALIMIPVGAIHTDPEYFPEPEKFNPDRFKNMDAIPKGVFFPFGGGPRICIAMRLAMLKMKVFLAIVLTHCDIFLSKKTRTPLKLDPRSFLQHVEGGLWLKFEPRSK